MARNNNPVTSEVKEEILTKYHEGEKPKSLSEQYGVSENTIRSWIRREKDSAQNKKCTKKKIGAPKGNKNALGNKGGAPKGNKNAVGNKGGGPVGNTKAVSHGLFLSRQMYGLTEEEKLEIMNASYDEEQVLVDNLALYNAQIERLQKKIEEITSSGFSTRVSSITETQYDNTKVQGTDITTTTEDVDITVSRWLTLLNSVMSNRDKCAKILAQIRADKKRNARDEEMHVYKMELIDAQIEQIDTNTQRMRGTNVEIEDTSEADKLLYGDGDSE